MVLAHWIFKLFLSLGILLKWRKVLIIFRIFAGKFKQIYLRPNSLWPTQNELWTAHFSAVFLRLTATQSLHDVRDSVWLAPSWPWYFFRPSTCTFNTLLFLFRYVHSASSWPTRLYVFLCPSGQLFYFRLFVSRSYWISHLYLYTNTCSSGLRLGCCHKKLTTFVYNVYEILCL